MKKIKKNIKKVLTLIEKYSIIFLAAMVRAIMQKMKIRSLKTK